jgi:hypothetical protein
MASAQAAEIETNHCPSAIYQAVEKAIPGFFNGRLAKDASDNLTNFLALSESAKFGTTSCAAPACFSTGCYGLWQKKFVSFPGRPIG